MRDTRVIAAVASFALIAGVACGTGADTARALDEAEARVIAQEAIAPALLQAWGRGLDPNFWQERTRRTPMNEEARTGFRFLEIDDEAAGILAYAVDGGEIREHDVASVWTRFEDAKANGKKVRIYAEMSAMPSASGAVIVEKFNHLRSIMSTMDRMAIVGDAGWMGIYAKIVDPITKFDVKHFTTEQRDQAVAWIRE